MTEVQGQSRAARILFATTALGAVALDAAHVFVGGPRFVSALFGSRDLEPTAQWMGYFVWHTVSVVLGVIALAFIYLALRQETAATQLKPLALFATALLLGVAALGVVFGLVSDGALSGTPAPYAFGVLALLAVAGTAKLTACGA
ncbi:MAG: hypothetical protein OEU92_17430 [Alphaproteobacteria bacterium]|nr:hypothetical protein [Alphaproteobacteria bacterium]